MMDSPPPNFWLYQAAFLLQAAAVACFLVYALKPKRSIGLGGIVLLAGSLLAHAAFTLFLGFSQGRLPLANGFEAISAWGLVLTALVVQVEWRHRLGLLGAFLAPLSAATLLMGFRFAKAADAPAAGLDQAWLLAHVFLAMVSYALFTAAAGAAGAYLVQDHQLKSKRMGSLSYELPPLQSLEALLVRLAGAGLAVFSLAVAAGYVWRLGLGISPLSDDPKVGFSIAMALAYALGLLARWRGPLGGRRFAWLCILLFLALFFGVYLVNLYLGGHAFLRPQGA
jgi:ABC-type transport system involved in cytochrome c biogenesis permease subunit